MLGMPRPLSRASAIVLTVLGATFAAADAEAAAVRLVRPPGGGITPVVGDPVYRYSFEAYLQPGFQINLGDFIRVLDLPGVRSGDDGGPFSPTGQPQGSAFLPPGTAWTPVLETTGETVWPETSPPLPVDQGTVTFYFSTFAAPPTTAIVNDGSSEIKLGTFSIDTYADLPELSLGFLLPVSYITQAHDLAGNVVIDQGILTLSRGAVPEPSSILMLGLGVGVPALWAARRRRRASA